MAGVWQKQRGPGEETRAWGDQESFAFVLKAAVGRGRGGRLKVLGEGAGESRDTALLSLQKGDPGPCCVEKGPGRRPVQASRQEVLAVGEGKREKRRGSGSSRV